MSDTFYCCLIKNYGRVIANVGIIFSSYRLIVDILILLVPDFINHEVFIMTMETDVGYTGIVINAYVDFINNSVNVAASIMVLRGIRTEEDELFVLYLLNMAISAMVTFIVAILYWIYFEPKWNGGLLVLNVFLVILTIIIKIHFFYVIYLIYTSCNNVHRDE